MKKILGIGVVVLLVGALIGGGAYLLLRDSGSNGSGSGGGGRNGQNQVATADAGTGGGRWNGDAQALATGTGGGRWNGGTDDVSAVERGGRGASGSASLTAVGGSGGYGGENTVAGTGTGTPAASVAPEDWLTVSGVVVAMDQDLVVRTAAGEELTFSMGPSWYYESKGIPIAVGDEVRVTGFYEDGELMAGTVENLSLGQALALRNESGQPLWSGRGRRGQ